MAGGPAAAAAPTVAAASGTSSDGSAGIQDMIDSSCACVVFFNVFDCAIRIVLSEVSLATRLLMESADLFCSWKCGWWYGRLCNLQVPQPSEISSAPCLISPPRG